MVITIDGLGVNGKSTLAKRISSKLNFKNFNTGAIYRCIALEIIENKLNIDNIEDCIKNIRHMEIDFEDDRVYLNKKDVTSKIRTEQISVYSTKWATIPKIKEFVRGFQKDFIEKNNIVMEGRDIATRIAPNAEVKFYLYSDFETRVKRLWNENKKISIDEIRENLKIRDDLDLNGGNFVKPIDAIEIDTTNYTLDEVYQIMINEINKAFQQLGLVTRSNMFFIIDLFRRLLCQKFFSRKYWRFSFMKSVSRNSRDFRNRLCI